MSSKVITKKDPFKDLVLDKYEQEIEDSIPENYDFSGLEKDDINEFIEAARKHSNLKVSKRINIRINNEDLARVRAKAKVNNIPYQTLIGTLVHKYAKGDIKISL